MPRKAILSAQPCCDICKASRPRVLTYGWRVEQRRLDARTIEYYLVCMACGTQVIPSSTNVAAARLAVRTRFTAGKGRHFESAVDPASWVAAGPRRPRSSPPDVRAPGHLCLRAWCPPTPRAVLMVVPKTVAARGLLSMRPARATWSGLAACMVGRTASQGPHSRVASAVTGFISVCP